MMTTIMTSTLAETDWLMFIGRLHPLVVHMPIGMLAALVIVEMMTVFKKPEKITATRRFLVWATALSAITAAVAGWFLAGEGGYAEDLLFWHRWIGIAFAVVLFIGAVIALTPRWASVLVRFVVLSLALGLMTVAGHMGGTMTHGETYLTRYAPPFIANLIGPGEAADAPAPVESNEAGSDAQIVLAMLEARCYECHGASKQKGRLRLDTPDGIATVTVAGDPSKSEMFRRISLPQGDFDIMPPEGEPIGDAEVLAVMRWIRDGAETMPTPPPTVPAPNADTSLTSETSEPSTPAPSESEIIESARTDFGAFVTELPGDELVVDLSLGSEPLDVAKFAELAPIAPRVVDLSLAGRTITGELGEITFERLERLRLERSNADDAFVNAMLDRTPRLRKLNLHSTPVTDGVLGAIEASPALERVVLFETGVTGAAIESLRARRPELVIEKGEALADAFTVSGGPRLILAADYSTNRIALMREVALGAPTTVWEFEIDNIHDLHILPNGNILFQTSWTQLVEVNPETNETVWSYDASTMNRENEGERVEVHAFERRPDGSTMIAESGPSRIIEVDHDGKLLSATPLTVDNPDPHHDTRLVRTTPEGNYLVAHEFDGVVREYDRVGNVIWAYDVPTSWTDPITGAQHEGEGNALFSAVRLDTGNTLIGTGNGHGVIEVNPEGEIVWSVAQNEIEGVTLTWVTTVQRLSNGNTVIGNCHAGEGQPQIIEVTPEKELVWKFYDFKRFGNALSNSFVTEDTHGGP